MINSVIKIREILQPKERRSAVILLGFMLVGMVLEMLSIGLLIPMITLMMQGDLAAKFPSLTPVLVQFESFSQGQLIIWAMVGLVSVYLIKNLFLAFLAWRQTSFAYGVQEKLSQRLFSIYLRLPYSFHLQNNSAQLIRNVTTEVNFFSSHALMPGMLLLTESLVILGIGSLLLMVEPVGALFVVLLIGSATWGFYRISRTHINRWGVKRQYHEGLRIQHLQQGLGGVKDVKLLGRENSFLSQYEEHNIQSARSALNQMTLQQLPRLSLEFLAVLGLALLVISMALQGQTMVEILPSLGFFAMAAFRLMPSVNRILTSAQTLRFVNPVIELLYKESKNAIDLPKLKNKKSNNFFKKELQLQDISFTYAMGTSKALDQVSLSIKKGEMLGFVGSSGSGKSTLVDIILGLLSPTHGSVCVDGEDIQLDLRSWQDQIGYVPQSIYLTDDTLRRNVAFGLADELIDDLAVERAIKAAQLESFVASMPDGIESLVGERGIRLSGGQRQRIGIARALYHDPAVLVLDEATSALDMETERGVMEAVAALQGTKTILIVAHRLSTVEQCDRLYHIQEGKIVAVGTALAIIESLKMALQVEKC